jgi:hypothetical protein
VFQMRSTYTAMSLACADLGPLVAVGVLGVILEIHDSVEGETASRVRTRHRLDLIRSVRRKSEPVFPLEPFKMPVQVLLPGQLFRGTDGTALREGGAG